MKKRNGSRMFFLYAAVIIISVSSIVSAFSLYSGIETLLIEEKGKKAMSISIVAAKLVEQDYTAFHTFVEVDEYKTGTYDDAYYKKMQQTFLEIRKKTGAKFVYCGKRISDTEMVYLFDGEDPESKLFSPLGARDNLDAIEQKVYSEKNSDYTPIMKDPDWGDLLTGVTPIVDPSTGETVAHVGVDVSVEQVQKSLTHIKTLIFLNAFIFIIITALIIYKLLCMKSTFMETDYLTGLYSKGYEERFLEQLIKKSTLSGKEFSLIMIDFDDFKTINDQYGHQFGDAVLKSVADIIKKYTRSIDCCARYGGDEFVVILADSNLEYAALVCQWLLKEVSGLDFRTKNDLIIPVSISIGIALWNKNMTPEQILVQADKALYHSKRTGKGKMVIYSDGLE